MHFDVVTVGNTLVDALLTFNPGHKNLRFNPQTNDLSLKMGEKFLADGCTLTMGGGAGRVAVGLSRLGYKTTIFAETGKDALSEVIISSLKASGVGTENLVRSDKQTSFTVGINYKSERTLLTHHETYAHEFDFSRLTTKWIYLGSLGPEWKSVYRKVEKYVNSTDTFLAFNPGKPQFLAGHDTFSHLFPLCDMLFVNRQEAETLTDSGKAETIASLLKKLHKMGPKTVVVTDGKNGSACITQSGVMYSVRAYPCEVIEKTGAGDAYVAGFLAAILAEMTVQTAMSWGSRNASSTIGHIGGEKGLLTKEALLNFYDKNEMIQPVKLNK